MEFGPVAVANAQGAILAHSVGVDGGRIRKGCVLSGDDVARLRAAGHERVTVARLGPGDIGENDAALAVARALVPDPGAAGLRLSKPFTGRVNILADKVGVARLDVPRLQAVNAVDAMITLATVPQWQRMAVGGMVATVKVISYGVSGACVDAAAKAGQGAVVLAPVALQTASLIVTTHGAGPGEGKGLRAIRARLDALGVQLIETLEVPHDTDQVAGALSQAKGAIVLILTASATSDIADVAPAAVIGAQGRITRFGMPVDPGNLLFYGDMADGRPVVGLPGCARSPALNGADWVLERLVCGVTPTPQDIADMGVGGLLKEIPTRPQPRAGKGG